MPTTRAATGNSRPRIIDQIASEPATKKAPRKKAAPAAKANTSKPRDKKVASGRVGKKAATGTGTAKAKGKKAEAKTAKGEEKAEVAAEETKEETKGVVEKAEEKVEEVAEKVKETVKPKAAKKVCFPPRETEYLRC